MPLLILGGDCRVYGQDPAWFATILIVVLTARAIPKAYRRGPRPRTISRFKWHLQSPDA